MLAWFVLVVIIILAYWYYQNRQCKSCYEIGGVDFTDLPAEKTYVQPFGVVPYSGPRRDNELIPPPIANSWNLEYDNSGMVLLG